MAGNIKGITVEIGGDTTKLGKAITEANKHTNALQRELKGVNTLLKFDPRNVTLLKQKQDLLTKSIKESEDKLKLLKSAMNDLTPEQIEEDEEGYRDLQREIASTEQKIKKLKEEQRNFGSVGAQIIADYGKKLQDVGGKIEDLGNKFMGLSTTTGAVLTGSAKLASDFTDSVAKVGTVADTSKVSLETLSTDILNLSTQTGKSANEIADATYQAISASVDTADAVNFVGTASNLAKAGFLETADAVDVLTTIINAYGLEAEDATRISDILVQTQNDGKTTVNELSQSMGQVIPLASAYGVNIENLSTAYAQLTKNGVSTAQSGTYLKSMLNELGDSGSTVGQILKDKTDKSFGQLMADGMSLGDVLGILDESVKHDSEAMAGLWGSTEAGTGALSILSSGVDAFNDELGNMEGSVGNVDEALETLDTPSAKLNKSINALKNTGIELGSTLLEMVVPVLQTLAEKLQALFTWFSNLSPGMQQMIVIVLGIITVVGPLLIVIGNVITAIGTIMTIIPPLIGGISALWAVIMANPFVAIAGLISAFVVGLIYAYNHSETFRNTVNNAFNTVKTVVTNVITTVKNTITTAWDKITTITTNLKTKLSNIFNGIKTTASRIFNGVKSAIEDPIQKAKDTIEKVVDKIKGFFEKLKLKIPKPSLPSLPSFSLVTKTKTIMGKEIKYPAGFDIHWNALGAIFKRPTIFNTPLGMQGVGEAGPEAVAPISELMKYVTMAVDNGEISNRIDRLETVISNGFATMSRGSQIVLDTGVLVGETIDKIDSALAVNQALRARGV